MRAELQEYISFVYGPSAWKEIVAIEAEQRKAQRAAVYAKQEQFEKIINNTVIATIVLLATGIGLGVLWYIGVQQGKW
jgi:hypothetical protein